MLFSLRYFRGLSCGLSPFLMLKNWTTLFVACLNHTCSESTSSSGTKRKQLTESLGKYLIAEKSSKLNFWPVNKRVNKNDAGDVSVSFVPDSSIEKVCIEAPTLVSAKNIEKASGKRKDTITAHFSLSVKSESKSKNSEKYGSLNLKSTSTNSPDSAFQKYVKPKAVTRNRL